MYLIDAFPNERQARLYEAPLENAIAEYHWMKTGSAKFAIGEVVRHRIYPFRGVIFDVDPEFANTEEWWESIPEDVRPSRDQPFYHLLAENDDTQYIAYVSEQNLVPDQSGAPVKHPRVAEFFELGEDGAYHVRASQAH